MLCISQNELAFFEGWSAMSFFRRLLGWGVGVFYALLGARRRALSEIKKEGNILPIVVHALKAQELEKIFSWLDRHGILEKVFFTIDDGWMEVKKYVSILEKYNVKAILFIAPGETLRGDVWTHTASDAGVGTNEWRAWYGLGAEERYAKIDAVKNNLPNIKRYLLEKEDIIELSKHPLIEIGNHTWSHLSCTHVDVEDVVDEVLKAGETLERWTGKRQRWLAWPFGRGNNSLDEKMLSLGLKTLYTRQGYKLPYCRNMAIEDASFQENLGRILGAWPQVGETK
jgi:peptidoglycan/xylan/chitin deacetylase (PgdA/CDA1 family)